MNRGGGERKKKRETRQRLKPLPCKEQREKKNQETAHAKQRCEDDGEEQQARLQSGFKQPCVCPTQACCSVCAHRQSLHHLSTCGPGRAGRLAHPCGCPSGCSGIGLHGHRRGPAADPREDERRSAQCTCDHWHQAAGQPAHEQRSTKQAIG